MAKATGLSVVDIFLQSLSLFWKNQKETSAEETMTEEQYERWKDFSRRMVRIVKGETDKNPSGADVLENINFFFGCRMDPNEEWRNVVDWDNTRSKDYCPGDHMSDLAEVFIPNYWSLREDDYEAAVGKFCAPVDCCVRAGLDLACKPSAGVAGFTAGQVREMYIEGVPDWVKEALGPGDVVELKPTTIGGIFLPVNERFDPRTFDELLDEEQVWL